MGFTPNYMGNSLSSNICIFISLDQESLNDYFNPHDPGPLYKRQLSHAFELYSINSIASVKRYSVLKEAEFEKFKRRSYKLLFFSLSIVMVCTGFLPLLLKKDNQISSGPTNTLDVFSWVITGTIQLYYLPSQLNGATESTLKYTDSAAGGTWLPEPGSTVNTRPHYVQFVAAAQPFIGSAASGPVIDLPITSKQQYDLYGLSAGVYFLQYELNGQWSAREFVID